MALLATASDGRRLKISFRHERYRQGEPQVHRRLSGLTTLVQAQTECEVWDAQTEELVVIGRSWCSFLDPFCKEEGRKWALARAIENGRFDRATAGALRQAYYGRPRGRRQ